MTNKLHRTSVRQGTNNAVNDVDELLLRFSMLALLLVVLPCKGPPTSWCIKSEI